MGLVLVSACGRAGAGVSPGAAALPPAAVTPPAPPLAGVEFLRACARPWPAPGSRPWLVPVNATASRVAIYDNALVVLVFERLGLHDEAGRVLASLEALQREDGSIPFSFELDHPEQAPAYIRSGALAWVGYAAVRYLDDAPGGPGRDAAARMAHRIAAYLEVHRIARAGDPRDGLFTGGDGDLDHQREARGGGAVTERFTPGPVEWASVEHNIDAFFFLRDLGRLTGQHRYAEAAERTRRALLARAWDREAGQFRRGVAAEGRDDALPLDCASWGALFLLSAGERALAATALSSAESRFASIDPRTGVTGHRPYAFGPVFEEPGMVTAGAPDVTPPRWEQLEAVWPEGSAGVALAALRMGQRGRAIAVLAELERLRDPSGALPMMTADVAVEFDHEPSVAATAWVELVRAELAEPGRPFLWAP